MDVGKKISELYQEINELGVNEVELVFKNLYIVIGCCILICCIVSFLIIPLQQFYVSREFKLLGLCRTFGRKDMSTLTNNILKFLKQTGINQ